MKKAFIALLAISALLLSCNGSKTSQKQDEPPVAQADTLKQEATETKQDTLKPLFGYRFVITGDFDGDGRKEKLVEHFVSGIDGKETNKYYEGLKNYDQLVELTIAKEPVSFVVSSNKRLDTLHIGSGGQLLGLSFMKNEGDLNGDGTDELSYVVSYADWSNSNTCYLVTYKNKKWVELYSFDVWDSEIPSLPRTTSHYGLFGLENLEIDAKNDSIDRQKEKELLEWEGFIKKLKTNKIKIITASQMEEGEHIVDLRNPKKRSDY